MPREDWLLSSCGLGGWTDCIMHSDAATAPACPFVLPSSSQVRADGGGRLKDESFCPV